MMWNLVFDSTSHDLMRQMTAFESVYGATTFLLRFFSRLQGFVCHFSRPSKHPNSIPALERAEDRVCLAGRRGRLSRTRWMSKKNVALVDPIQMAFGCGYVLSSELSFAAHRRVIGGDNTQVVSGLRLYPAKRRNPRGKAAGNLQDRYQRASGPCSKRRIVMGGAHCICSSTGTHYCGGFSNGRTRLD